METTQTFQWRAFTATGLLVLGVLAAYFFLPAMPEMSGSVRALLFGLVFFVLVPMAHVRFILGKPLSSMGFSGSASQFGIVTAVSSALVAILAWFLLISIYGSGAYAVSQTVRDSFLWFLFYEIVLVGAVTFVYEVFFRGLVMLSWLSGFGAISVVLQFLSLLVLLGIAGGIGSEDIPMLLSGAAAGFTAYRTRSIWYSWATAWLVMMLGDVLLIIL